MNTFIHGSNTSDTRLVAALAAMGIACEDQSSGGAVQSRSGITRTWVLSAVSNCGKWKLSDLLKWWRDKYFHVSNPTHPFNRVKCALASDKAFGDALKGQLGMTSARRGDSLIAVCWEGITPRPPMAGSHVTDDFRKAAAFMAMNVEAHEVTPNGNKRLIQISPVGETGAMYDALNLAWIDNGFHIANPQHPFAYVKTALWNYTHLVSAIKKNKPLVEISRGESFAYLHPDCSSETEKQILSQFDL